MDAKQASTVSETHESVLKEMKERADYVYDNQSWPESSPTIDPDNDVYDWIGRLRKTHHEELVAAKSAAKAEGMNLLNTAAGGTLKALVDGNARMADVLAKLREKLEEWVVIDGFNYGDYSYCCDLVDAALSTPSNNGAVVEVKSGDIPEVAVVDENGHVKLEGYYFEYPAWQQYPVCNDGGTFDHIPETVRCLVHYVPGDWGLPNHPTISKITPPHKIVFKPNQNKQNEQNKENGK